MALCFVLLCCVGLVVSDKLSEIMARVEAQKVRTTVTRINSTLQVSVAMALMSGKVQSLGDITGFNPLVEGGKADLAYPTASRLDALVPNGVSYLGELSQPNLEEIPSGKWFFDVEQETLVYMVESTDFFETPLPGPKRIRYRVKLSYVDSNHNGRFEPSADRFEGVSLEALEDFKWIVK